MGRRVAILCVNPWDSPGSFQPFSYAAHRIEAALSGHPGVDDVRVFEGFGWSAGEFADNVEAYQPDVIGGSTYVWSLDIFLDVLRLLRPRLPNATLVLGGPSARPAMFGLAPYRDRARYVDALVLGDGEEVIRDIVAQPSRDGLEGIDGLALFRSGLWRHTTPRGPIRQLDALPSPYQSRLAPSGVSAHFETFRGCPLSCAFCEWGGENRGSYFSKDYLVRELEAFRALRARNVFQVDAGLNLNAKAFQNLAAAEAEVGFIEEVGLVCEIYPSLLRDDQLEFLKKTRATIGIGLQSYNESTLRAMDRPFHPDRFDRCVRTLTEHNDTTATLILGLPGDTPAGFRETMRRALDLPCNLRVYHCLVLPDALMTRGRPEWDLDFDPYTLQLRSGGGWSESDLRREQEWLVGEVEARCGTYAIQPIGEDNLVTSQGSDTGYGGETTTYWFFPTQRIARCYADDPQTGGPLEESFQPIVLSSERRAAARVSGATRGAWRFESTRPSPRALYVTLQTPRGPVEVEIARNGVDVRSFRVVGDVAYSYRFGEGVSLPRSMQSEMEAVIHALAHEVVCLADDGAAPDASARGQ